MHRVAGGVESHLRGFSLRFLSKCESDHIAPRRARERRIRTVPIGFKPEGIAAVVHRYWLLPIESAPARRPSSLVL